MCLCLVVGADSITTPTNHFRATYVGSLVHLSLGWLCHHMCTDTLSCNVEAPCTQLSYVFFLSTHILALGTLHGWEYHTPSLLPYERASLVTPFLSLGKPAMVSPSHWWTVPKKSSYEPLAGFFTESGNNLSFSNTSRGSLGCLHILQPSIPHFLIQKNSAVAHSGVPWIPGAFDVISDSPSRVSVTSTVVSISWIHSQRSSISSSVHGVCPWIGSPLRVNRVPLSTGT